MDFILGEKEFELARWISKTYFCNLGVALNLFFTDKVKARRIIERIKQLTNPIELINDLLLLLLFSSLLPPIKYEIYIGNIGSIHGEIKDMIPSKNVIKYCKIPLLIYSILI